MEKENLKEELQQEKSELEMEESSLKGEDLCRKMVKKLFNKCRVVATILTVVLPPLGAAYWLVLTHDIYK